MSLGSFKSDSYIPLPNWSRHRILKLIIVLIIFESVSNKLFKLAIILNINFNIRQNIYF